MRNTEPVEGQSANGLRIAVLAGFPVVVALLIGLLGGNIRNGLVIGAGIGFGLAFAVLTYGRLAA
jgi:mannose/fructose/N-acetylgalactosamine-specific phosphotransferase system component IIC